MLKTIRRILAVFSLLAMIALFTVPCSLLIVILGWLPKCQLVPAVMAMSVFGLIGIALSVALFGRLYCSACCPLGITQDLVFRHVGKGCRILDFPMWARLLILLAFVTLSFLGFSWTLDPYAIWGRAFAMGAVGWLVLAVILIAAAFKARWWCNNVCPVGTLLGLFARFAVFRIRIKREKCVACEQCVRACATGAIPKGKDKRIDYSRCVSCYNCIGTCKKGALSEW